MTHSPPHSPLRLHASSLDLDFPAPDEMEMSVGSSSVYEDNLDSASWRKEDNCFICHCKFSALKSKRHHCRFCGNSVCNDHSLARRSHVESSVLERICDKCDYARIGGEYKASLLKEIDEKRGRCHRLKEEVEVQRLKCLKVMKDTEEAEKKGNKDLEKHEEAERLLERKIEGETNMFSYTEILTTELQQSLDRSSTLLAETQLSFEDRQQHQSSLFLALESLHSDISTLEHEIDSKHEQAKTGISHSKVPELLCPLCCRKLLSRSVTSDQETTVMTQKMTRSLDVPKTSSGKSCSAECSVM